MKFLRKIYFLLFYIHLNDTAKILGIFPFPGPSQYLLVQPYLKTLARRGHELTVISAFPQKVPLQNYRDIYVPEVLKYVGDILGYINIKQSKFAEIMNFSWYYSSIVTEVLNNESVQNLLKSKDEQFDLLIIETLQTDALLGFAEHFNTSIVGVSSFGTDPYIDALVNNISPMAYTPLATGSFTETMNFLQRLQNMWYHLLIFVHREFIHKPVHENLYRHYFPSAKRSLDALRQNISVILLNQHFSLSFPRPYVTNMIEVGGFHLQKQMRTQSLSRDIVEFINSSTQDVVYFSMGSNIKSEHFPAAMREMFLSTFSSLPYKFLWKFENPSLIENRPANVFISKWFSQADILAQPRVKLFITHGGLLSLIESIYYCKPILGIPIFYDQFVNVRRAEEAGLALAIKYQELNYTILRESVIELIENAQYMEEAKKLSQIYQDQIVDPMAKAIYWTEYVLRHRGAAFLRSPGLSLNYWQRNSWDCVAVVLAALLCTSLLIVKICIGILKSCCKLKFKYFSQKLKLN